MKRRRYTDEQIVRYLRGAEKERDEHRGILSGKWTKRDNVLQVAKAVWNDGSKRGTGISVVAGGKRAFEETSGGAGS